MFSLLYISNVQQQIKHSFVLLCDPQILCTNVSEITSQVILSFKWALWPHINIVLLFLVVERGLNSYSMSPHQVCIPIIPKQRNDMYQKIILNRDIAIWSFISVLIWEQIVHLILLSIDNNMIYLNFFILGSFFPHKFIWDSPYCRGMMCYLHFRRHITFTYYNFHTHVVYCITIFYHICCIDK